MKNEIIENIDVTIIPNRNKWMLNEQWKADHNLRMLAKDKGEMFYSRWKPCKNGHFKRYVTTDKCVECAARGKSDHKKLNPEHTKKQRAKHGLKSNYGISLEDYENLLIKQDYKCALCKKPENSIHYKSGKIRKLAVDHCHDTNKVRGLLCINCNMGIGKLKHDPKLLRLAALYCED